MFVDTSGLLCFHNQLDAKHTEAARLFNGAVSKLTHSYVLAEFVPLSMSRRLPRVAAMDFVRDVQDSPTTDVVYVDAQLHRDALDLLRNRLDKLWSLCDAVSFRLMQLHGETEALTTDHHFEQAGFVRLLNP